MPSATTTSVPFAASFAGSDGRTRRPESSLISRTQPTSVCTLAASSKAGAGGSPCGSAFGAASAALFLPNIDCPLLKDDCGDASALRQRVHESLLLADDELDRPVGV